MARYSREQRERAVGLYERYGHSAADVIRDLGYPSRGALRIWYRDWLEERRTGIPSVSFVKSRWTCSAVDLDTVGVHVGRCRRLVSFAVVLFCLLCLFHE